jgi:hypothetical protein
MRHSLAALLLLILVTPARALESGGLSLFGGAGDDYRSLGVGVDLLGKEAEGRQAYGFANWSANTYQRGLKAGGGLYLASEADPDLTWRLGAAAAAGRVRSTLDRVTGVTLEGGVLKALDGPSVSGEYALTFGTLGGTRFTPLAQKDRQRKNRAAARPERTTYHELAGTLRSPWQGNSVWGRLSLGIPSGGETVLAETVGLGRALSDLVWGDLSFTLQQGGDSGAFLGFSLRYEFLAKAAEGPAEELREP